MGLSKLSEKCSKCPKKNKCNHKKMEALAHLKSCRKSVGKIMDQPLERETMTINVGGTIQIVYKDDIEKDFDIGRNLINERYMEFGA